jgi:hypothetical protein
MTLQEFNSQSLSTRSDLLYEWGFYISSHKGDGVNTVLYAINGFFAELTISLLNNNVLEIKAYESRYLSHHDLETIRSTRSFLLIAPGILQNVS